jgi:hypothetical protein
MLDWLTEPPGYAFPWDGFPDPLQRIGAHVMCFMEAGIALSHAQYVETHAGCPPGCAKLPEAPRAHPDAPCTTWGRPAPYQRPHGNMLAELSSPVRETIPALPEAPRDPYA